MSGLMPALFIGHGSPMQAIEPTRYTAAWRQLADALPRPQAILCISAHWYVPDTAVTAGRAPRTIHDFYGFPPALYQCQYPAPGDPALAQQVQQLLQPQPVGLASGWGLDHGSWSVLRYMYPEATLPVLQLSVNATLPPAVHYELGRRLAPLRQQGVLVLGSGDVVHNLRRMQREAGAPPVWAERFNDFVRSAIVAGDHAALIDYATHTDAALAVPTPEHYLPLLYVLGTRQEAERATVPVDGIEAGTVSMLCVQLS